MKRASFHCRAIVRVLTLCLLSTLWGCSEIRLNTLPAPPPTAKLRVFVLPITSTPNPRGAWMPSERDFSENQYRKVARILERKGIYRVIPEEEARAATAGQSIEGWQWARGNWNLAKEAGRALHADYVLIFERKFSGAVVNKLVFLSLRTDKAFEETLVMPGMAAFRMDAMDENREMIGVAYQKIFMAAKGDMFLKETIPSGSSVEYTIDAIKEQGGLVCIPHPFDPLRSSALQGKFVEALAEKGQIDVLEVLNARILMESAVRRADKFAKKYSLLRSAGSDAHGPEGGLADGFSLWRPDRLIHYLHSFV